MARLRRQVFPFLNKPALVHGQREELLMKLIWLINSHNREDSMSLLVSGSCKVKALGY